jgi:hypothetical protein
LQRKSIFPEDYSSRQFKKTRLSIIWLTAFRAFRMPTQLGNT